MDYLPLSGLPFKRMAVSLAIFTMVAGCAAPRGTVHSKRDPAYQGQILRVLIISQNERDSAQSLGRNFPAALTDRLSSGLQARGAAVEVTRPEPDALDAEAPIRAAAAGFRPRQFLSIGLTRVWSRTGVEQSNLLVAPTFASDVSVTFQFTLSDLSVNKPVCAGELRFGFPPSGQTVADLLLEHLATEGLLPPP